MSPLHLNSSAFVSLLCLAWASTAQAQVPSCARDLGCMAVVEQALALSKSQQFEDALRLYEQAYARVPDPGLLSNLGRMQQRLGKDEQAITTYRLYLIQPPLANDHEHRRKTQEWLVETLQHQQNLHPPTRTPPTAALDIDQAMDITTKSVPNSPPKPGRSVKLWVGVSAAIFTSAALAIGLGIGLSGCKRGEICINY